MRLLYDETKIIIKAHITAIIERAQTKAASIFTFLGISNITSE